MWRSYFVAVLCCMYASVHCFAHSQTNSPKTLLENTRANTTKLLYGQNRSLSLCRRLSISATSPQTYLKPLRMILRSQWVPTLKEMLQRMKFHSNLTDSKEQIGLRKQVTVVFGDAKYTLSLLNWLVSALVRTSPPLENIIVISVDRMLQELLDKKNITSVYVNPDTVTCVPVRQKISRIWITRCAIYRMLNHWGYDVMAYDTDAIVLKNIQDILDSYHESDIIGSTGTYPFELGTKWGHTLCMGVVLFRSTTKTDTLWNVVTQAKKKSHVFDDQVNINNAFNNCDIKWSNNTNNKVVTGQCAEDKLQGLKVTVLPASVICRRCHSKDKDSLYVWHKQSKKSGEMKMKTAISTHTWHLKNITLNLREDACSIIMENKEMEKLKGIEWIQALSNII